VVADFALTLPLVIAAKTRTNSRVIAQAITELITYPDLEWDITSQGYINFRFSRNYYQRFLQETWQEEGKNFRGRNQKTRVNLEYVSANPTGYLHLAHLRQAIIGNTLANVYQFLGYEVTREYYINDRGEQITSLINSVYYFYHKFQNASDQPTNHLTYPGQATRDAAHHLIAK
jgi:arginyl-tRNA synthetase